MSSLRTCLSTCSRAESLLPGLAFAAVFVATLLVWIPYSKRAAGPLAYDPGLAVIEEVRASLPTKPEPKAARRRLASLEAAYNERRALGCEDAPETLRAQAEAAVKPPPPPPEPRAAGGNPETKAAGETASLSGTGNWRAASLIALTFTLVSFVVTIVVIVYGLRRMRLALKPLGSCNCRIWATAIAAVLAWVMVCGLAGKLGFLGVPAKGLDLGWDKRDASAKLTEALGQGTLLGSLTTSRSPGVAGFLHKRGGLALCMGYAASVILVGAYAAALLRARQVAKAQRARAQEALDETDADQRKTKIAKVRRDLAEARTEIREGSADPKTLLYAAGALFVAGLLAHATHRTAALAFVPSDRGHLQACFEALAQTETVCIAIVYSLFLAATYYPAASLTARRDRFLREQQALLNEEQASLAGSGDTTPPEKLDVLGILRRLLVVVAPVVASLLVDFLKALGTG